MKGISSVLGHILVYGYEKSYFMEMYGRAVWRFGHCTIAVFFL